jgi:hypothetical protein
MSNTIATRKHKIYSARQDQLAYNILSAKGGRPYVDARLWRAPNESDLSWFGTGRDIGTVGRKKRAAYVNDAGRIVSKITQYLFKVHAERNGIDEAWSVDVDGSGTPVNRWWIDASEALTAGQWCWVQVDRAAALTDADGTPRERTILEKQRDLDFVRWTLWPSTSVPDWAFDSAGRLLWLITESDVYDNADPNADPKESKLRTLWQVVDGHVEVSRHLVDGSGEQTQVSTTQLALNAIPFALIGTPTEDPWWFDDVEMLQAQCMNLDSLHVENLVRTVYPQLIIPQTMLEGLEMKLVERCGSSNGESVVEAVREIVRGLDSPIIESAAEANITRFIQPNASDLKAIPDETDRKRKLLFDLAGLALFNRETRQIQTAESKQFDQLDTESTLKHRALILQDAERQLVELSKLIDPMFTEYEPVWPSSFDVVDVEAESAALGMLGNLPDATPAMRKLALVGALRVLAEVGGVDKDLVNQARQEIEAASFDAESDVSGLLDGDTTGKIPLAIQQLALARERAKNAGDETMATKLGVKIDELTARI